MSRLSISTTLFGLFCLSAVISVLTATSIYGNNDDKVERRDSAEEVEVVIRRLYQYAVRRQLSPGNGISTEVDDNGDCSCTKNSCECCQQLSIPKLRIDKKLCVNVAFLSQQLGIKLTVTLDGRQIYSTTATIKQPPPMCFKLSTMLSTCLYLYDIAYTDRALSGCARMDIILFKKKIAEINMSCFQIPLADDIGLMMTSWSDVPVEGQEISSKFRADNELLQRQLPM